MSSISRATNYDGYTLTILDSGQVYKVNKIKEENGYTAVLEISEKLEDNVVYKFSDSRPDKSSWLISNISIYEMLSSNAIKLEKKDQVYIQNVNHLN
jgi:hypothetical protein